MKTQSKTLVVNLFGGPGVGKSTTAALAFGELKKRQVDVEIVHEVAKDYVWEERHRALVFQPYVIAKQHFHVHRLMDKVDVVITDSPILLGSIYRGEGYTEHLGRHLLECFAEWNSLNFFLRRNSNYLYDESGRYQTEQQAQAVDKKITDFLDSNSIHYYSLNPVGSLGLKIADEVQACLTW